MLIGFAGLAVIAQVLNQGGGARTARRPITGVSKRMLRAVVDGIPQLKGYTTHDVWQAGGVDEYEDKSDVQIAVELRHPTRESLRVSLLYYKESLTRNSALRHIDDTYSGQTGRAFIDCDTVAILQMRTYEGDPDALQESLRRQMQAYICEGKALPEPTPAPTRQPTRTPRPTRTPQPEQAEAPAATPTPQSEPTNEPAATAIPSPAPAAGPALDETAYYDAMHRDIGALREEASHVGKQWLLIRDNPSHLLTEYWQESTIEHLAAVARLGERMRAYSPIPVSVQGAHHEVYTGAGHCLTATTQFTEAITSDRRSLLPQVETELIECMAGLTRAEQMGPLGSVDSWAGTQFVWVRHAGKQAASFGTCPAHLPIHGTSYGFALEPGDRRYATDPPEACFSSMNEAIAAAYHDPVI